VVPGERTKLAIFIQQKAIIEKPIEAAIAVVHNFYPSSKTILALFHDFVNL